MSDQARPVFDDVIAAARRLRGHAVVTPLLESQALNDMAGAPLLIKAEMLQRTGSFKFRGAYNRISQLEAAERAQGVVAYSSGNHAQGVAAAAAIIGTDATIVMPKDAPAIKTKGVEALGGKILAYDRDAQSREQIAEALAAERGVTLVRPYDDPWIISGQGTVGLELANQCAARGVSPTDVLVPCGGGGLISGCALALTEKLPGVRLWSVEPDGYDDTARSLRSGQREVAAGTPSSSCDALLAPTPGELTFAINKELLWGGLAVTEDWVLRTMALVYAHLKVVVEPGGAVALAAALSDTFDCRGKTVAVVCSGGNVDPAAFSKVLRDYGTKA